MPTITVNLNYLWKLLGQEMTNEEFENLCFDFGLEVDFPKEGEVDGDIKEGEAKVETPANRYDLLSVEGLAISLGVYLGKMEVPKFAIAKVDKPIQFKVHESTQQIRGVCLCAVLRGIQFTQESYDSFIDLQDKLHQNLGRRRTLVSIGTHDLDTIKGPFVYSADAPKDIKFVALKQTKEMDAIELFEFLRNDVNMKLKPYLPIIEDSPVYPVIRDSNGVVLSLPPIINGEHSKITLNTKNVLIEITAVYFNHNPKTDYTKAMIGLNNIVTAFSLYTQDKFTFEQVEITKPDGSIELTPRIEETTVVSKIAYINQLAGLHLTHQEIAEYLKKMSFAIEDSNEQDITVKIPIYRSDVLHACDVAEDLAIAYGFENIQQKPPTTHTVGKEFPLNKMTDLLRVEMCAAGYMECLNFALCSIEDNTKALNLIDESLIVTTKNPKTTYFQCGRISLLPGLLKTLSSNKNNKLPVMLFEVTDVILQTSENSIGAKNQRRLAAIRTNNDSAELSNTHGLVDFIMQKLNVPFDPLTGYSIELGDSPTYFGKLQAVIKYKGSSIGNFGILHPTILEHFGWSFPISAVELNIEPLVEDFLKEN